MEADGDGLRSHNDYSQQPVKQVPLSYLERLSRTGDKYRALQLLQEKNKLVIDNKYRAVGTDPNYTWTLMGVSVSVPGRCLIAPDCWS